MTNQIIEKIIKYPNNTILVGPERSGKTFFKKRFISKLLTKKKDGLPLGLTVIDSKGELAKVVSEMSEKLDLPYKNIDHRMPNSAIFNPMEGEMNIVSEITANVLKRMFGEQDNSSERLLDMSIRNITKLLKVLNDNLEISQVIKTMLHPILLEKQIEELKQYKRQAELTKFLDSVLLGRSNTADEYLRLIHKSRSKLESLVNNNELKRITSGKSDINIDRHYAEGGILTISTGGDVEDSISNLLTQFLVMHLQNGMFRRPGTEMTRVPHFLIVDECSRYINPDVELFLSLAAEYRVAGIFATQSLGQLELESGKTSAKAMKWSILANCRNMLVFGAINKEEANCLSEYLGEKRVTTNNIGNFTNTIMDKELQYFSPVEILGLPINSYIHQLKIDDVIQKPDFINI